jgi:hypothetical protein
LIRWWEKRSAAWSASRAELNPWKGGWGRQARFLFSRDARIKNVRVIEVAAASPFALEVGRVGALLDAVVVLREELIGTLLGELRRGRGNAK